MGGTNIKAGLVDGSGSVLCHRSVPTGAADGPEAVVERIARLCSSLAGEADGGVAAVGVGAPGPLDHEEGIVIHAPNLPGWDGLPLKKMLERRLGLEVHIENDANAAALAEFWVGWAAGAEDLVCITLGTGLGGGVLCGGRLLRGRGFGAELGHMKIQPLGRRCGCGGRGCWEAYVSATAVCRRYTELSPVFREGSAGDGGRIECREVFELAAGGDETARLVLDEFCMMLGIGLGSLLNLFNPSAVVLAGGVTKAGREAFLERALAWAKSAAMPAVWEGTRFGLSELPDAAGVIGAAAVARGLGR